MEKVIVSNLLSMAFTSTTGEISTRAGGDDTDSMVFVIISGVCSSNVTTLPRMKNIVDATVTMRAIYRFFMTVPPSL
jgi:hypothetical protein